MFFGVFFSFFWGGGGGGRELGRGGGEEGRCPCPAEPHVIILAAKTINHVGSGLTADSCRQRRGGTPPVTPAPRAPVARGGEGPGPESAPQDCPPRDLRLPVGNLQDPERIFPAERAVSAQPRSPPHSCCLRPLLLCAQPHAAPHSSPRSSAPLRAAGGWGRGLSQPGGCDAAPSESELGIRQPH